jgi:hypothetical protein
MRNLLLCLLLVTLGAACSCGEDSNAKAPPEVKAPPSQPPAVETPVKSAQPAAPEAQPKSAEPGALPAAPQPPPAMIPAESLGKFQAEKVGEWARIELRSVVIPMAEGEVAQSDAVYQIGKEQPLIQVSLLDTRGFVDPQKVFWSMHDHPNKGINVAEQGGWPSLQMISLRPMNTVLMTLVDKRYLIIVNGEGSELKTVQLFLDAFDLKKLAELK